MGVGVGAGEVRTMTGRSDDVAKDVADALWEALTRPRSPEEIAAGAAELRARVPEVAPPANPKRVKSRIFIRPAPGPVKPPTET
jgi:hypothetical protein